MCSSSRRTQTTPTSARRGPSRAGPTPGSRSRYCIVTDGDAGGSDRSIASALAGIRRDEQRAAAAVVGVQDVCFLGYPDGALVASNELRRDICRVVRTLRPDRVVCQSPERYWDAIGASHPDHLAAGEATVCAFYPDVRNPFAHPELLGEGLEPHTVRELWSDRAPGTEPRRRRHRLLSTARSRRCAVT